MATKPPSEMTDAELIDARSRWLVIADSGYRYEFNEMQAARILANQYDMEISLRKAQNQK